jgi:hypothetical protein
MHITIRKPARSMIFCVRLSWLDDNKMVVTPTIKKIPLQTTLSVMNIPGDDIPNSANRVSNGEIKGIERSPRRQ